MKPLCTLALALLLATSGSLKADDGDAMDLTTISGKTYSHCQIMKVYPDGVAFRHDKGIAKVLFTDLKPELRKQFGYDPEKVRAYERKVKEDNLKIRETAAARAEDARQAWIDANQGAVQPPMPYDEAYAPGPYYGYNDFVPMNALGLGFGEGTFRYPLRAGSLKDASGRFFNEGRGAVTVPTYGRLYSNLQPVNGYGFNGAALGRPWCAPRRSHASYTIKKK